MRNLRKFKNHSFIIIEKENHNKSHENKFYKKIRRKFVNKNNIYEILTSSF